MDIHEARKFFELQEQRLSESQRLDVFQEKAEARFDTEDSFTPEEAKALLWESEEMKQPVVGYRIVEKVGRGGSASVFKAEEMATGTMVALKLLYPGLHEDKKTLKEFVREGMTLIKLKHPNILQGLDFGFSKGFYFMVLEFVEGESLGAYLDRGKLVREKEGVKIVYQVAKALLHLDDLGIVHRDVKPSNLMVVDKRHVKLADFGLCLDRNLPKSVSNLTTCGTVEYMSPEQARGEPDLDVRTDIYALGATLYHMLCGSPPFTGETQEEVMRKHVTQEVRFDSARHRFSQPVEHLITRMMEKDRERRYQTAHDLITDIELVYGIVP